MKYVQYIAIAVLSAIVLTACNEDKFTSSIFPDEPGLDPNSYTYEFDKYLYETYLKPYNIAFQYKLGDETTDMLYNLVPVKYEKASQISSTTCGVAVAVRARTGTPGNSLRIFAISRYEGRKS